MPRITTVETFDLRFPTSLMLDGSDAMNRDPDYSAAYLVVRTDVDGLAGHGFAFTIGRGNEIQCMAIESLAAGLPGRDLDAVLGDLGAVNRELVHDSQFRWLGPEKRVIHMAAGAILNALWDLRARRAGQPLWRLLAGLAPRELVDLVDFRYRCTQRVRRTGYPRRRHARTGCPCRATPR
jgi:L-fuconate dehydratase